MQFLSRLRFNALAGYARGPLAKFTAEELAWFEQRGERVLGAVFQDQTDRDYAGVVFGRDRRGRFRAIWLTDFEKSQRRARALLRTEMERLANAPDDEYYQGDEVGQPVDFFAPRVPRERLHPNFVALAEHEAYSPARGIIGAMMNWYDDADGNFIEQFQTMGFDARLWELYLFAAFREMGYQINRIHAVPDFVCEGVAADFAVEATTVNATRDAAGAVVPLPPRDTPEQLRALLTDFMPMKFGSPLTTKLSKRYWERPSAADKPLLFAIQDFSAPASMVFTRTALPIYLYGRDWDATRDALGRLQVRSRAIAMHRWGDKEIPSGFFALPDAENISGVLFSNSGTIAKFNRMGHLAGFGSKRLVILRQGCVYDPDPDAAEPKVFQRIVGHDAYTETWVEGVDVFHNPHAKRPLDPWALPHIAHHRLGDDGLLQSVVPDDHPVTSVTRILVFPSEEGAVRALGALREGLSDAARDADAALESDG